MKNQNSNPKKISLKNVKVERNIVGKEEIAKYRSTNASNLAKDDQGQNFQKN